ncbi:hypothetical protein D7X94_06665 [Acutalibacter sp. 1XD8-33]|uniref:hypothetical protein n=1 Tax=Acutalibacter sp. 1XD8-33 TaxID=2320081 RepID=UPI000EA16E90|nr:hypothetical protein [Acutalibacter sp. 1XD8-33]RKJ40739.1 hypothetical protein D7X94_06665 [Acutalibacter sp. 1XD8-33]
MRSYDYSFLSALSLPEGLSSLLAALKSPSGPFGHKAAWKPEIPQEFDHLARTSSTEKSQDLSLAFSAYTQALAHKGEPLLSAPCLVLDILCINPLPLEKGALLGGALLKNSGYPGIEASPLGKTAQRFGFFFQRALERSQIHWAENGNDYLPFLEMFLAVIYLSIQENGPANRRSTGKKLTKRVQIETFVLESATAVSKAEICAALPQVSPTTVEAVLGSMVRERAIIRIGGGRGTRYLSAAHSLPSQQ